MAAARLSGARVLVHDHLCLSRGGPLREAGKRLRALFLNRLFHERLAVSGFVARTVREVHRVPAGQVCVVENGVDASRFERADGHRVREELRLGDARLVACVSRLDDDKGVEWLVRAVPRISRGAHLALVGEGSRLPAWRALSERLEIASRVHFLGLRHDVEEVLAASSVVVSPSVYEEAFGLAVLEGMAAGRPMVLTQSGAMPEIVQGAGLLVPVAISANLYPVKGHLDLIEALEIVRRTVPDVLVLCAGEGPMRPVLEQQIRARGLRDNVVLLGHRLDVPAILQRVHIGCLCSHAEGLSNAVIESMAASLPVVATAVGGNVELVTEADSRASGQLVPPHRPAVLADRLLSLLRDPARAASLGAAGRSRVESDLTLTAMIEKTGALYEQVLSSGRAARRLRAA